MLLDNKKLTLIKYKGTKNFIAGLFFEETEKKHYFGFMRTHEPSLNINNEGEYADDLFGSRMTFVDRYCIAFEVKGKTFGKNEKMFSLIHIEEKEFDSMYKLLECIYDE